MASFFFSRNKTKTPTDLVKTTRDLLPKLWEPSSSQKTAEELARLLSQMKLVLQGTQGTSLSAAILLIILHGFVHRSDIFNVETDSSPEQAQQLVTSVIQEDLLLSLARSVHLLPFESRKDTQAIFSYVLRFKPPYNTELDAPALLYVINHRPEVIIELCRGYEHKESAMPCGTVLREIMKHDEVVEIILYDQSKEGEKAIRLDQIRPEVKQTGSGVFWKFFSWIDRGAFEVSTDAFTTFREILTKHKNVVPQYLATNFDLFFSIYNSILVQSPSYVTKRQSIKLLGEILLDRANYNVMTAYVDRGEHLKLCMNLLKDDRKMVQYEGFHVFKVFVANPHKSVAVQRILLNNRDRLLKFLPRFLEDRTEDDQFTDEKSFLVRQIETMPPVPVEPAKSQTMVNGSGNGAVAANGN